MAGDLNGDFVAVEAVVGRMLDGAAFAEVLKAIKDCGRCAGGVFDGGESHCRDGMESGAAVDCGPESAEHGDGVLHLLGVDRHGRARRGVSGAG